MGWLAVLILLDVLLVVGILVLLGVSGIHHGAGHDRAFTVARRYVLRHAPHRAHRVNL